MLIIIILAMIGVYLLLFSYLGAWVAIQCERSAVEGAVIGVILGPFGLILEALLPRGIAENEIEEPRVIKSSEEVEKEAMAKVMKDYFNVNNPK
jgi:hypothetical protein